MQLHTSLQDGRRNAQLGNVFVRHGVVEVNEAER
jgi:hypothetical protein